MKGDRSIVYGYNSLHMTLKSSSVTAYSSTARRRCIGLRCIAGLDMARIDSHEGSCAILLVEARRQPRIRPVNITLIK